MFVIVLIIPAIFTCCLVWPTHPVRGYTRFVFVFCMAWNYDYTHLCSGWACSLSFTISKRSSTRAASLGKLGALNYIDPFSFVNIHITIYRYILHVHRLQRQTNLSGDHYKVMPPGIRIVVAVDWASDSDCERSEAIISFRVLRNKQVQIVVSSWNSKTVVKLPATAHVH